MSQTVPVDLGERSYYIHIDDGLIAYTGLLCADSGLKGTCLLVSDSNVAPLYSEMCVESLASAGFTVHESVIPAGEGSKSEEQLFALYEEAIHAGLDRSSFVVALGGGVVGDLAGFLASTLFRGIRLVQVPTSLLAMVDSSVGGKTGINLPSGKNLVGAFHQPSFVVIDPEALKTLPEREYISGLAEVIKYGVIRDTALFSYLEEHRDSLLTRDSSRMQHVIARCCEIKAEVVGLDEREGGVRAILNFGHTLGHALEQAGHYTELLHGEGVAVGMLYAARLSASVSGFPEDDVARLEKLISDLKLPTVCAAYSWEDIRRGMAVDKKVKDGTPRFVLADRLGKVSIGHEMAETILRNVYDTVTAGT